MLGSAHAREPISYQVEPAASRLNLECTDLYFEPTAGRVAVPARRTLSRLDKSEREARDRALDEARLLKMHINDMCALNSLKYICETMFLQERSGAVAALKK